jgi:DUF1680 family protein
MMSGVQPVLNRIPEASFDVRGIIGDYLRAVTDQWLLPAPASNPGMLEMFRDRDRKPYRDLVPWAGEFAGKYLTGAVQVWRLTRDERLAVRIRSFVEELLAAQDEDGYLGPWPRNARLTNHVVYPDGGSKYTWDAWGHYHIMLGLMLWHEDTADARALRCACRMADLMCDKYLGSVTPRLSETGSTEMNLAPVHALALLARKTGNGRYHDLAVQLLGEFGAKDGKGTFLTGNYLEGPLAGQEFFELPRPRWESLHPIMGMPELYYSTGDARCREAFTRIWDSIRMGDRHNNGGFSSGEQAIGNPYDRSAIETCCTIAWHAMTVEMLRLTGESRVADELELTLFNSIVGMHAATGRWATYDTPMDGVRRASAHSIVFQAREGTPELNCCSVNSARGFGLLSDWAVMQAEDGAVHLNYYGPGCMTLTLADGSPLTLVQETRYPFEADVTLTVSPGQPRRVALALRIPAWSRHTDVRINGAPVENVPAGSYCRIDRVWTPGDRVAIRFDFSLHGWIGHWECDGRTSLYRGPILLAYDRRYNAMDPEAIPAVNPRSLAPVPQSWTRWMPPAMLVAVKAETGTELRLVDYGSAGEGGTPYASWLPHGTAPDRLPEYFAPSPSEHEFLDLMRYSMLYARFLNERSLLDQKAPWVTPVTHLKTAQRLEQEWPAFKEKVAALRVLQASGPQDAGVARISAALARLSRPGGVLAPDFGQRLSGFVLEVRDRFDMPDPLTVFVCSPLCLPVADIATAQPPRRDPGFRPVTAVTDENFCDIRQFHQGGDGLLFIRTTVTMEAACQRQLVYGADGPVRVWVNGESCDCHPEATNPARATSFRIDVAWRKGYNEILVALGTNHGRAWGIFAGLGEMA